MRLEGEKIYLRPIVKDNLPFFVKWLNDEEVDRYLQMGPKTMEEEVEWFEKIQADKDEIIFSIFLKHTNQLIGNCGIHLNWKEEGKYKGKIFVGLMIGEKEEWGKGYCTDTLKTLLMHLKDNSDETEVYLTVDELNIAGQKCYAKCGFRLIEKNTLNNERKGEFVQYVMKVNLKSFED